MFYQKIAFTLLPTTKLAFKHTHILLCSSSDNTIILLSDYLFIK